MAGATLIYDTVVESKKPLESLEYVTLTPSPEYSQFTAGISKAIVDYRANGLVHIGTITGLNAKGRTSKYIDKEITTIFNKLEQTLITAGSSLELVLKINVFYKDLNDIGEFDRILNQYFPLKLPSVVYAAVKGLSTPQAKIQLDAVACLQITSDATLAPPLDYAHENIPKTTKVVDRIHQPSLTQGHPTYPIATIHRPSGHVFFSNILGFSPGTNSFPVINEEPFKEEMNKITEDYQAAMVAHRRKFEEKQKQKFDTIRKGIHEKLIALEDQRRLEQRRTHAYQVRQQLLDGEILPDELPWLSANSEQSSNEAASQQMPDAEHHPEVDANDLPDLHDPDGPLDSNSDTDGSSMPPLIPSIHSDEETQSRVVQHDQAMPPLIHSVNTDDQDIPPLIHPLNSDSEEIPPLINPININDQEMPPLVPPQNSDDQEIPPLIPTLQGDEVFTAPPPGDQEMPPLVPPHDDEIPSSPSGLPSDVTDLDGNSNNTDIPPLLPCLDDHTPLPVLTDHEGMPPLVPPLPSLIPSPDDDVSSSAPSDPQEIPPLSTSDGETQSLVAQDDQEIPSLLSPNLESGETPPVDQEIPSQIPALHDGEEDGAEHGAAPPSTADDEGLPPLASSQDDEAVAPAPLPDGQGLPLLLSPLHESEQGMPLLLPPLDENEDVSPLPLLEDPTHEDPVDSNSNSNSLNIPPLLPSVHGDAEEEETPYPADLDTFFSNLCSIHLTVDDNTGDVTPILEFFYEQSPPPLVAPPDAPLVASQQTPEVIPDLVPVFQVPTVEEIMELLPAIPAAYIGDEQIIAYLEMQYKNFQQESAEFIFSPSNFQQLSYDQLTEAFQLPVNVLDVTFDLLGNKILNPTQWPELGMERVLNPAVKAFDPLMFMYSYVYRPAFAISKVFFVSLPQLMSDIVFKLPVHLASAIGSVIVYIVRTIYNSTLGVVFRVVHQVLRAASYGLSRFSFRPHKFGGDDEPPAPTPKEGGEEEDDEEPSGTAPKMPSNDGDDHDDNDTPLHIRDPEKYIFDEKTQTTMLRKDYVREEFVVPMHREFIELYRLIQRIFGAFMFPFKILFRILFPFPYIIRMYQPVAMGVTFTINAAFRLIISPLKAIPWMEKVMEIRPHIDEYVELGEEYVAIAKEQIETQGLEQVSREVVATLETKAQEVSETLEAKYQEVSEEVETRFIPHARAQMKVMKKDMHNIYWNYILPTYTDITQAIRDKYDAFLATEAIEYLRELRDDFRYTALRAQRMTPAEVDQLLLEIETGELQEHMSSKARLIARRPIEIAVDKYELVRDTTKVLVKKVVVVAGEHVPGIADKIAQHNIKQFEEHVVPILQDVKDNLQPQLTLSDLVLNFPTHYNRWRHEYVLLKHIIHPLFVVPFQALFYELPRSIPSHLHRLSHFVRFTARRIRRVIDPYAVMIGTPIAYPSFLMYTALIYVGETIWSFMPSFTRDWSLPSYRRIVPRLSSQSTLQVYTEIRNAVYVPDESIYRAYQKKKQQIRDAYFSFQVRLQAEEAFNALHTSLTELGISMLTGVVKLNLMVTHPRSLYSLKEYIRERFLDHELPSLTIMVVSTLPHDALVQLEVIAASHTENNKSLYPMVMSPPHSGKSLASDIVREVRGMVTGPVDPLPQSHYSFAIPGENSTAKSTLSRHRYVLTTKQRKRMWKMLRANEFYFYGNNYRYEVECLTKIRQQEELVLTTGVSQSIPPFTPPFHVSQWPAALQWALSAWASVFVYHQPQRPIFQEQSQMLSCAPFTATYINEKVQFLLDNPTSIRQTQYQYYSPLVTTTCPAPIDKMVYSSSFCGNHLVLMLGSLVKVFYSRHTKCQLVRLTIQTVDETLIPGTYISNILTRLFVHKTPVVSTYVVDYIPNRCNYQIDCVFSIRG